MDGAEISIYDEANTEKRFGLENGMQNQPY